MCLSLGYVPAFAQPQKPPSVLSLNLCYDALLIGLAAPQQRIIVTRHSREPGVKFHSGRLEEIISLAPDVVLANPYNDPLLIQALRQHAIAVVILPEPSTLTELEDFWHALAESLDSPSLAQEQITDLEQLMRPLSPLEGKRILSLQANHYSFGGETLFDAVVQRLGAENLAARQGNGLVTVLPEQVLAWQPDIIVLSGNGSEPDDFALAHRNTLHRALRPLLSEGAVTVSHQLSGCMAQRLPEYVEALLGASRGANSGAYMP